MIENRYACPRTLQDISAAMLPAKNIGGSQPSVFGDIDEIGWRRKSACN